MREGDYFGTSLNRAAWNMSAAHGEQILLSAVTAKLFGERTLALNPNAFMAHNNLAALLIGRGDFKTSEYHSRESIKLKPDDYVAYANLANALRAQGKLDEAIQQTSHGIAELDRRIEVHQAAAHDRIVNQMWTIKSELILQRGEMVRARSTNSYGK